jgi:hypothetical protein
MKVLALIVVLLVVLWYFRNVEGFNDKQIDEDKDRFVDFFDKAKTKTRFGDKKSENTPLDKLDFVDGSGYGAELRRLVEKYRDKNNNQKDITMDLSLKQVKEKLNYRKHHN